MTGDGPPKEIEVEVDALMTTEKDIATNMRVQTGPLFENTGRLNSEPGC